MNEEQWLRATWPQSTLPYFKRRTTQRKLRLYACAVCRTRWHLLDDSDRRTVETAEHFAEGQTSLAELSAANSRYNLGLGQPFGSLLIHGIMRAVTNQKAWQAAYDTTQRMTHIVEADLAWGADTKPVKERDSSSGLPADGGVAVNSAAKHQMSLIRDIFGNPFRPVTLDPTWRTSAVVNMAQAIYDNRAFERLPLLADALEDAGCHHEDILAHCRGPGPHVRGCWVVDLLTGRA